RSAARGRAGAAHGRSARLPRGGRRRLPRAAGAGPARSARAGRRTRRQDPVDRQRGAVVNDETVGLLLVVGVMAVNQLVRRIGGLRSNRWVFYALQLTNLAAGTWVILFGVPGLTGWPIVSFMIGLIFFFRTVQNNNDRLQLQRERREAGRAAER